MAAMFFGFKMAASNRYGSNSGLKFSLEKLISCPDPISSFSYPAPTKFFVIQIYCPNLLIININCPYGTLKSIQSDGGGRTSRMSPAPTSSLSKEPHSVCFPTVPNVFFSEIIRNNNSIRKW